MVLYLGFMHVVLLYWVHYYSPALKKFGMFVHHSVIIPRHFYQATTEAEGEVGYSLNQFKPYPTVIEPV